jgi:hypothetical protein
MKGFTKHQPAKHNFNPLRSILNLLNLAPEPEEPEQPIGHKGGTGHKCRKHQCRRASRQFNRNARPRH